MFFDALHINTQWTLLQSVWAPLQPPAVAKKYATLHYIRCQDCLQQQCSESATLASVCQIYYFEKRNIYHSHLI